ncbi:MAG: hypothetical protein MUF65_11360, partial [Rubritepida sp.]|nr:hypothetical protein [Rubritepida sp.]
ALVGVGMWIESPLLFSWQAVSLVFVQLVFTVDAVFHMVPGLERFSFGWTSYMFDPNEHLEHRLLTPDRLEAVLAALLDRRQERTERRRGHIAELNRRASETEARLKRLYDAIEAGVADLADPALKERIDGLKAIRDQARVDAGRAQAMLEGSGDKAVTPDMLRAFAAAARDRMRLPGGGYRRDHLRALAQRVEVHAGEVRIIGSKSRLLQTLAANSGVTGVPTQGLNWRAGWDSNPRWA